MATQSEEAKARAEAKFRKEQQRSEAAEAVKAEMQSKARAVDANTARLKALRLAKEDQDRKNAVAEPAFHTSSPRRRKV